MVENITTNRPILDATKMHDNTIKILIRLWLPNFGLVSKWISKRIEKIKEKNVTSFVKVHACVKEVQINIGFFLKK